MASEEQASGLVARWLRAARDSGPGWLLSAYTLGAGSAVASLWAGYQFGYQLLWVQPLAMLMGVIALSGAAYVFVHEQERPYRLFWRIHPVLALSWALGSLFASIIWHFPQYGLAWQAIRELGGLPDTPVAKTIGGFAILVFSTALTWSYARGARGLRLYEALIKGMVWLTVLCLAAVVIKADIAWREVLRGLFLWRAPAGESVLLFGMLSAAVGINMTFLYPYSIQAKEWEDRADGFRVAVRDLLWGMFVPYTVATALMILAAAATRDAWTTPASRQNITAMGQIFTPLFGSRIGPTLFYLGLLAMPLSSITLHMLTCGFIVAEMAGKERYSTAWRLGTLAPAIGMCGVAYKFPAWLPVSASALALIFLPIAYLGFTLAFMRELATPRPDAGSRPRWLLGPMIAVLAVIGWCAVVKTVDAVQQLSRLLAHG